MTRWVLIALALACAACGSGSEGNDRTNGEIAFGMDDIYAVRPDGSGPRNLTRTKAREWAPAWSPDGTKIAFTAVSSTPSTPSRPRFELNDIFVMAADGSGRRRLTSNGSASDSGGVSWSPDGGRIAFESSDGRLLMVESDGGRPQTLVAASANGSSELTDPAWSPDGARIAFVRSGSAGGVYVVAANGEAADRLTRNAVGYDVSPSWSPDGESIAFCRSLSAVHVVSADGGAPRLLARERCGSAAWSPDGTQIAFTANRDGLNYVVFVMKADGSERRQVTRDLDSGSISWGALE